MSLSVGARVRLSVCPSVRPSGKNCYQLREVVGRRGPNQPRSRAPRNIGGISRDFAARFRSNAHARKY